MSHGWNFHLLFKVIFTPISSSSSHCATAEVPSRAVNVRPLAAPSVRGRLDLEGRRLLSVDGYAQTADLLLDGREDCDYGGEGLLVLTHHPPDVLDVLSGVVLVAGIGL